MKRKSPRLILIFAASALIPLLVNGQTNTIVVPKEAATTYGDSWTYEFHYGEQVYAPSEFAAAGADVIVITGLAFRVDEEETNAPATVWKVSVDMNAFPGSMSDIIQTKTGVTNAVHVFAGEVYQPSVSNSSLEFNLPISLKEPFAYDRGIGPLVVQTVAYRVQPYDPYTVIDAQSVHVAPAPGLCIYLDPDFRRYIRYVIPATQFSYLKGWAKIEDIESQDGQLQVTVNTLGTPIGLTLEGAPTIIGPFTTETADFTEIAEGKAAARVPISSNVRFFRLRWNE